MSATFAAKFLKIGAEQSFEITEHGSSGYLWNLKPLEQAGVRILRNEVIGDPDPMLIGGPVRRRITVTAETAMGVVIRQGRPWMGEQADDDLLALVLRNTAENLLDVAMDLAGRLSVETPEDRLVTYTVSYLPTPENKRKAIDFIASHAGDGPDYMRMEQTEAGGVLESLDLFGAQSGLTRDQAYQPWFLASRRLVAAASGNVTAFCQDVDPRSTFASQELRGMLRNPRITTINGTPKKAWLRALFEAVPALGACPDLSDVRQTVEDIAA